MQQMQACRMGGPCDEQDYFMLLEPEWYCRMGANANSL